MNGSLKPFTSPDAILSDDIDVRLDQYLDAGGDLTATCEALMESYDGVPDMLRALIEWIDLYGSGIDTMEQAVQTVLQEHEVTVVPRLDEALADSDKAQTIISAVTNSPRWKPVVTQMAERNRESTLHNLLTRESRLSQAGMDQQVLQSPTSFLDAIAMQFTELFGSGRTVSDTDLTALYKRVSALCTYDECSTIVALRLFSTLSIEAEDPLMRGMYRRMAQEVRKEAVNVMKAASVVPDGVARQYVMRTAILVDHVAAGVTMRKPVIDALMSLLTSDRNNRKRFDNETKILLDVYGRLVGDLELDEVSIVDDVPTVDDNVINIEEKVVLIRSLCHIEIFEDVLKSLFSHEHRTYLDGSPDLKKRKCLCLLLSFAGVFICMDDHVVTEKLNSAQSRGELVTAIKRKFTGLDMVATVCEELTPGCPRFKIKGKAVDELLVGVKDPLIARGIMMWAKEGLHGGPDLRALMVTAPKHLAFLEAIAERHHCLRGEVLEIIRNAFMRDYPGLASTQVEDLRDMFMKTITGMVRIKMGPQIVHVFQESWADDLKVDRSHLRRFVDFLLRTISPPYSRAFASSVLQLLSHKRVASAIEGAPKTSKLVTEFRRHVQGMGVGASEFRTGVVEL